MEVRSTSNASTACVYWDTTCDIERVPVAYNHRAFWRLLKVQPHDAFGLLERFEKFLRRLSEQFAMQTKSKSCLSFDGLIKLSSFAVMEELRR